MKTEGEIRNEIMEAEQLAAAEWADAQKYKSKHIAGRVSGYCSKPAVSRIQALRWVLGEWD